MQRKFTLALAAMLTCLLAYSPCLGQAMPKEKQAELAFEIRMDLLRGTPLYEMVADNMKQATSDLPDGFDMEKVKRIWGAVQFPETVAEMEAMNGMEPGSDLPMEMFFHVEFLDAASADAALDAIKGESNEVERGGKTYYVPKDDDDAPGNILGHKLNDTTLEAGTEGYLIAGAGKEVFSEGLGTAWGAFSDEPIRVAIDLDNARSLLDEAMELAKADAPPMAHGMLDLVNKASNLRLAIDLKDGGNILQIAAHGTNEETAEELRSGLDGMLGMAKMMGGAGVEELRNQDENMADVASAILRSLNAKRDGKNVEITIPKPDGFEDALKGMMQAQGMGSDF